MAFNKCTRCGAMILFGGKILDRVYCPSCISQLADEEKAAQARERLNRDQAEKRHNLALAREAYRAALEQLKRLPADPDRRQRAPLSSGGCMRLGRVTWPVATV